MDTGERFWVKYHFISDQGIEFWTQAEGDRLAGTEPRPLSAGEWKLDAQGCTSPRGALDSEGAAQCLDAVFQPDEP